MASQLTKIVIKQNPHYKRNGTKSYGHLVRKYKFKPTHPGPFTPKKAPAKAPAPAAQPHHQSSGRAFLQKIIQKAKAVTHSSSPPPAEKATSAAAAPSSGQPSAGEVGASDVQNDSLYLATVSIGTPAQNFNLDFDTGSADLWLWSSELSANVLSQGSGHTIFNPTKSSTYKATAGSTWKISYGDNSSASGDVGTDNVVLGGLTIRNQSIELAKQLSTEFVQGSGDGLLGLAFGQLNTVQPTRAQTPVENMISQSDIPQGEELFTAKLGSWRDANDPDKGDSFYTFGFIDQPTVTASGQAIAYTPIDSSQGFWSFASASATVNGTVVPRAGNTAIADTGTTLALVDDATCKAIYAAIPGGVYDEPSGGYIFPTNTTADKLPVVTFAVGDTQFAVQKEDLAFSSAKTGFVFGGIQSRGTMTFDILGDTFLKSIYAIFDQGNKRFGAVPRVLPQQNLQAPPS